MSRLDEQAHLSSFPISFDLLIRTRTRKTDLEDHGLTDQQFATIRRRKDDDKPNDLVASRITSDHLGDQSICVQHDDHCGMCPHKFGVAPYLGGTNESFFFLWSF